MIKYQNNKLKINENYNISEIDASYFKFKFKMK